MAYVAAHHSDTLVYEARAADSVRDVFAASSERMRELVQFDASGWLACDPAYQLPTPPTRSENMEFVGGSDGGVRLWELEFFLEHVNLSRDVARPDTPPRGLREASGDRP